MESCLKSSLDRKNRNGRGRFRPEWEGELEDRKVLSHLSPLGRAIHPLAHPSVHLSPPQNTLRSELNATIGRTPGVSVGQLVEVDSGYEIDISVKNRAHALAIASIVQGDQVIGNIHINIVVRARNGQVVHGVALSDAQQVAAFEEVALDGNPYFKGVATRGASMIVPQAVVFPIFSRSVVQFYDDNGADYYSNTTMVAADAFRDVLNSNLGGTFVSPSTAHA